MVSKKCHSFGVAPGTQLSRIRLEPTCGRNRRCVQCPGTRPHADTHAHRPCLLPAQLSHRKTVSSTRTYAGGTPRPTTMQAIRPGRSCRLGRFCRRDAASSPWLPLLQSSSGSGRSKGARAVRCATAAARSAKAMEAVKEEARAVALRAVEATPESFAPFGQVVAATPDGDEFGPHDAQLDLTRGIPRFYIMRLEKRSLKFRTITHHASVTQCLGSIGGEDWYLGVAKPSILEDGAHEQGSDGRKPVQSRAGHYYLPPDPAEVRVFRVSGAKFLKLHIGTWHAGPLFKADAVDFYNLELSNTNIVDHTTHDFKKDDGVTFVIED
ncbi:hypothetical protein E2562_002227 [Oryza meyeriana var. granulata]|uniref:Ureidoglycolate hydrolase n=1 Tax=Oryza meyeriana var. granulata TaxID=110450 RepID=A0A6G1BHS7_9ORYZ|nr:hypothetical protein E2562_002227 [Oryza meyeriana var. granulata]